MSALAYALCNICHVNLPFEYGTPTLSGIKMNPVFRCLVFKGLLYVICLMCLMLYLMSTTSNDTIARNATFQFPSDVS